MVISFLFTLLQVALCDSSFEHVRCTNGRICRNDLQPMRNRTPTHWFTPNYSNFHQSNEKSSGPFLPLKAKYTS